MITVTGVGRLTRDPEQRYLPSGEALAEFGVAFDSGKKGEATFIDAVVFGKRAEAFCSYFHKGKPVAISGELRQENWQDRATGQNRSKLKITVNRWSFVPRDADAQQPQAQADSPPAARKRTPADLPPPNFPRPQMNAPSEDAAAIAADAAAENIDDLPF